MRIILAKMIANCQQKRHIIPHTLSPSVAEDSVVLNSFFSDKPKTRFQEISISPWNRLIGLFGNETTCTC